MHMADALLSPAVGGTMWAATAVTVAYCARRLRSEADDRRVPLMGVLGAFLFAAQMINFSIPGTGSSGHLGGGLLLAILLGPARGVSRHGLGADRAGAVLRRRRACWRSAATSSTSVSFRRSSAIRSIGACAGADPSPARADACRDRCGGRSRCSSEPRRRARDRRFRHLGSAIRHVRPLHAADPSGDRRSSRAWSRPPWCPSFATARPGGAARPAAPSGRPRGGIAC